MLLIWIIYWWRVVFKKLLYFPSKILLQRLRHRTFLVVHSIKLVLTYGQRAPNLLLPVREVPVHV